MQTALDPAAVTAPARQQAAIRGTVVAAVLALAVFVIGRATGERFVISPPGLKPFEDIFAMFLLSAVAAGLACWWVSGLLARRAKPRRDFLVLSAIALIGGIGSPLMAGASTSAWAWFNLAHLVVAVALIVPMYRALPADAA